jgi:hypothetical protein
LIEFLQAIYPRFVYNRHDQPVLTKIAESLITAWDRFDVLVTGDTLAGIQHPLGVGENTALLGTTVLGKMRMPRALLHKVNTMNKNTLKSIGAILAGVITIAVLSNGTDAILEATGVFPPVKEQMEHGFTTAWMVILAFVYRLIFTVAGGYITAALAPNRPMRHAMILGIVGVVLSLLGAIATWGITPAWFSISLIVLALPCVWLGGKLRTRKV